MITIAIPTHNRAAVLRQTLEQLTRLVIPSGVDWEVIVAQNNCSDETEAMLAEFHARLPLRAIAEPRPGVNHARNAAVAAARGECILFTDDDTLPEPQWLAAYVRAFEEYPDVNLFGGPIVPHFPSEPPAWLAAALPIIPFAYGTLESNGRGEVLSASFLPFGANMAFRTHVLRERPFDPTLGPKGKKRINGSETELLLRLVGEGHGGRWIEDARVEHCIQSKQMTIAFLRWYFTGEGAAMAMQPPEPGIAMLWGRPRWLWREAIRAELTYRVRRIYGDPTKWIRDLRRASVARGRLMGRGSTFA